MWQRERSVMHRLYVAARAVTARTGELNHSERRAPPVSDLHEGLVSSSISALISPSGTAWREPQSAWDRTTAVSGRASG